MRSYRPEELFDAEGAPVASITALAPDGHAPHGQQPARQRRPAAAATWNLPDFRTYAVPAAQPAGADGEATRVLGTWLRDVMAANMDRFRVMGPDETTSNRLDALFEVTDRESMGGIAAHRRPCGAYEGRVMEVLSEHMCQGWLEGYLLTGRHGFFSCYEAFIAIVDSHVQPARQVAGGLPPHPLAAAHSPA